MAKEEKPAWLKIKPEEIESIVIQLAQKNIPLEKIGLILRDEHGIPSTRVLGKKLSQIIKDANIQTPKDIHIKKNLERIQSHLQANHSDLPAKKALTKHLWALNELKEN